MRGREEARELVRACFYPGHYVHTAGKGAGGGGVMRGFGPMYTHHAFGALCTPAMYRAEGAPRVVVIVQIENREAVEDVDGIAGVEGVDVLFVG